MATKQITGAGAQEEPQAAPMSPRLPFIQGAHEHAEVVRTISYQPTRENNNKLELIEVPSYGYLRSIFIEVTTETRGERGEAGETLEADAPFSIIESVSLLETNSTPIVGPIEGYQLLWGNIMAGTAFRQDPRLGPWFSNRPLEFEFGIRIPLEISTNDGLGCLANQDSAATFKLALTLASGRKIYSSTPRVFPRFTIRVILEAYTVPNATDQTGMPQEQAPPALGSGQYYTFSRTEVLRGKNTIQYRRVGNYLSAIALFFREREGRRSESVALEELELVWDSHQMWQALPKKYMRQMFADHLGSAVVLDTGVYVFPFNITTLGRIANGPLRMLWPTVNSSRIEIKGTSEEIGSVEIATVDMAVVNVNPATRYVMENPTGYHANPAGVVVGR